MSLAIKSCKVEVNVMFMSAASLGLQHRALAKSESDRCKRWGHTVLFVSECIPIIGIVVALVEFVVTKFFQAQLNSSMQPEKIFSPGLKSARIFPNCQGNGQISKKADLKPPAPLPDKLPNKVNIDKELEFLPLTSPILQDDVNPTEPPPSIPPNLVGKIEIDWHTANVREVGNSLSFSEVWQMEKFERLLKRHKYTHLSQHAFKSPQEIDQAFNQFEALKFAAEVFYDKYTGPSDPLSFHEIREDSTCTELFQQLLNRYQGICIGENHKDSSPKYILTYCMPLFKKLGVTTLYVEGFNGLQNALDAFCFQNPEEIPQALIDRIKKSVSYSDQENVYQTNDIFIAAKRADIRIINLDCVGDGISNCFTVHHPSRMTTMNFYAKRIIDLDRAAHPGKCILYSGFGHSARWTKPSGYETNVKSLAQMYQFPAVTIVDDSSMKPVDHTSEGVEPGYRISKGLTFDGYHHDFTISMARPFK